MSENTGTIKWFNATKGFGFIKPENGADVFVHISSVQPADVDKLTDGTRVAYDLQERNGKTSAANIKILK